MKRQKPSHTRIARTLRKQLTESERYLWRALRAGRLDFKFRRQVPLCGCVVDFVCFEAKVVVELDGSQHASEYNQAVDQVRDARLAEAGFHVLRFLNYQVHEDMEMVLDQIYAVCAGDGSPSPCPSSRERERSLARYAKSIQFITEGER